MVSAPRKRQTRVNRRPAANRKEPAPTLPDRAGPIGKLVATWWAPPLLLLALGGLIYATSLTDGFVLDDEAQITGNPSIRSLSMLGSYFTGSSMDTGGGGLGGIYYKPVMTLSYALIWAVAGQSGPAFHAFQLLLHILVAYLAFEAFRLFVARGLALALALIFLVHPINTECVVYAANLQDTLYMAFGLLALRTFSRQGRFGWWRGLATGVLLLLGMLSKETGALFVLVCGAYVYLFKRDHLRPFAVAAGGMLLAYLGLRFGVAHLHVLKADTAQIARASVAARLLTMPAVLWHYIATFCWPARLTVTQDWVVTRPGLVSFWLPLFGVGSFAAVVVWYWRAHRDGAFCFFALWTAAGLGLHSQLFPLDGTVADRWFYFTELGVLGMIGVLARDLAQRRSDAATRWPAAATFVPLLLVLAALGPRAHWRSRDWRDGATLYAHDLELLPDSFVLLNDYGVELVRADRVAEAEPYFRRSAEAAPHWNINWSNLGAVQEQLGQTDEAKRSLERSMANGAYAFAYENYARILAQSGAFDDARRFLIEEALPRFPGNPTLTELKRTIGARGQ